MRGERTARRHRTSLPGRVYRVLRASVHVFEGLATIAVVFPVVSLPTRRHLIRTWSARLLRIFALETRVAGQFHDHHSRGLVLVANHVSWLDIFVILAMQPARFVAKDELKRWPVVGWLIAGVGTLFIDRSARRHVHGANEVVRAALAHGDVVALFPEGKINANGDLLPFHGSLLQPAVDAGAYVQPVAIRYPERDASRPSPAVWAEELSFVGSVWRVTSARMIEVELTLFAPLASAERHRRELARAAEDAIRRALQAPADDSEPGRSADRPA